MTASNFWGIGVVRVQDGYKLIRASQLVALLAAVNSRQIPYRGLRVYLACQELLAIREAADRSRGKRRRPSPRRFRTEEVSRLLADDGAATVAKELRLLRRCGLLRFSENSLDFLDSSPGDCNRPIHGGRGETRLVPVPRKMLVFLAACNKPALAKTVIAYLLRGLSLARNGEVRGAGTVKVSWICEVCQISERAARFARAELIRLGWITKDTGSFQRKLNRDGAYFQIDSAWGRAPQAIAPRNRKNSLRIAPLLKRRETPSDSKDRKLGPSEQSGFCRKEREGTPKLRDIRPEDIRKPSRLRLLYEQAVQAGWVERNEASLLRFAGAAVRANRVAREPVRVFVAIVRKGLWHHISMADEDRARTVLQSRPSRVVTSSKPPSESRSHSAGMPGFSGAAEPTFSAVLGKLSEAFAMPRVGPGFLSNCEG